MRNYSLIENARMDIHVYVISMNHGCPFEYFSVNGFLGMDITMDIAWILQPREVWTYILCRINQISNYP